MFGFNIYFCIKQGKIATFSTSLQGLAVRRPDGYHHISPNRLSIFIDTFS